MEWHKQSAVFYRYALSSGNERVRFSNIFKSSINFISQMNAIILLKIKKLQKAITIFYLLLII